MIRGDVMKINSSELRELDVVNVCTGKRLGYVCDFVIDADCGRIAALIVSEAFFTLAGGKNTLCVPFENVECIGKDVILVKTEEKIGNCSDNCYKEGKGREKRKGGWFFLR